MKFVVYEVWTRARVIEANDSGEAYVRGEPQSRPDGLNLCNWHVVNVEQADAPAGEVTEPTPTGGTLQRHLHLADPPASRE